MFIPLRWVTSFEEESDVPHTSPSELASDEGTIAMNREIFSLEQITLEHWR